MAYIGTAYVVMAYIGTAYIVMAYVATAYVVMAYVATAYVVMAYIVMAYIVMTETVIMAYIVVACIVSLYLLAAWLTVCVGPALGFDSALRQCRTRPADPCRWASTPSSPLAYVAGLCSYGLHTHSLAITI